MIQIRDLSHTDIDTLTACFNAAFSDYALPIKVSPDYLQALFADENVQYDLSFGAFDGDRLLGFIVNAADDYQGFPSAYDAATGVVPEHRGKGLCRAMFARCTEALRARGIEKYYVDVLQGNARAIALYSSIGFTILRENDSLKGCPAGAPSASADIRRAPLSAFDLATARALAAYPPYPPFFKNSFATLVRGMDRLTVCYAQSGGETVAMAIYDKSSGVIKRIGRQPGHIGSVKEVLIAIGRDCPAALSAFNIDPRDAELCDALKALGLKEHARQYEMRMDLQ